MQPLLSHKTHLILQEVSNLLFSNSYMYLQIMKAIWFDLTLQFEARKLWWSNLLQKHKITCWSPSNRHPLKLKHYTTCFLSNPREVQLLFCVDLVVFVTSGVAEDWPGRREGLTYTPREKTRKHTNRTWARWGYVCVCGCRGCLESRVLTISLTNELLWQ